MDELTRLALAARRGDHAALVGFVRLAQPGVWRACAHLVDRASADDLTQEVFLRAIPALARFRGDSSARTWILAIARRACADAVRARQRQRRLRRRVEATAAVTDDALPAPDGSTALDELVRRLDPDRRAAFVLTQVVGLRYGEAAEVCGVPIGTIRSRVARARADLLALTADEAEETG